MSTVSPDTTEPSTKRLTTDSIDQLTDALDAVERVSDDDVSVSDAHVDLTLSPSDADRLDALVAALGGDVSVADGPDEADGPETPAPATVTTTTDGGAAVPTAEQSSGGGGERGPGKDTMPAVGVTQDPPSDPPHDPPRASTIAYAALAVLVAETDGDGWATTRDVAESPHMAYDWMQVQGAVSRLFRRYGLSRRARPGEIQPPDGITLAYQPTEEALEYVREVGRYPWPVDVDVPDDAPPLGDRPYVLPDEGGHPQQNDG